MSQQKLKSSRAKEDVSTSVTKDMNMNTDSEKGAQDKEGARLDFAELVTSANHKRYLQLVPNTLSDEDGGFVVEILLMQWVCCC